MTNTEHPLPTTADPVLPNEDRTQYTALIERYKLDFSPATSHEEFLVVTMVGARWRLERTGRMENAILGDMLDPQSIVNKEGDALARLDRHRASIERTYYRCTRELYAAKKWKTEASTTQLAEKKFNNLVHDYIYAPVPEPEIRPVQNKANPSPVHVVKTGRNATCPCGSGLKYKKCCLDRKPAALESAA